MRQNYKSWLAARNLGGIDGTKLAGPNPSPDFVGANAEMAGYFADGKAALSVMRR
jgi:hypothetical protein